MSRQTLLNIKNKTKLKSKVKRVLKYLEGQNNFDPSEIENNINGEKLIIMYNDIKSVLEPIDFDKKVIEYKKTKVLMEMFEDRGYKILNVDNDRIYNYLDKLKSKITIDFKQTLINVVEYILYFDIILFTKDKHPILFYDKDDNIVIFKYFILEEQGSFLDYSSKMKTYISDYTQDNKFFIIYYLDIPIKNVKKRQNKKMNKLIELFEEEIFYNIEKRNIFYGEELLVNPIKHFLSPNFTLLGKKEKEQLLDFFSQKDDVIKEKNLISFYSDDPVVRYYDASVGQIFKIESTITVSGSIVGNRNYYRIVKDITHKNIPRDYIPDYE